MEEFLAIFTKQYVGLIVGVVFTLIFRFFDQAVALQIAKKYNIKQKTIMQAAFPTLICFLQYLLRKRSKDSKLAALLSLLKRNNSVNNTNNNSSTKPKSKTDSISSQESSKNMPHSRSSYTTPKPLSSFSSVDTDCESVFYSDQTQKSKTCKTNTRSIVAKYKKTSQVSIKMSSESK